MTAETNGKTALMKPVKPMKPMKPMNPVNPANPMDEMKKTPMNPMESTGKPEKMPMKPMNPMNPIMPMAKLRKTVGVVAVLALAGCGGGGGSGAPSGERMPDTPMPSGSGTATAAGTTGLYFDYTLERAGEPDIEEAGSVDLTCPASGCAVRDLRELAGNGGNGGIEGTGTRGGFGTVTGTAGGPPLTETLSGVSPAVSATVTGASFTRYGFWGEHGWAAVEVGEGSLSAGTAGERWRGDFEAAHAWAGGDASGSNPGGAGSTGSAVWRGIAEAARTADFTRLMGTATVTVADLSRPRVGVVIDVPGHDIGAPGWADMAPAGGRFASGTAGADYLEGAFHGPGHEEAWGVFDTGAYVGAFGAKRE